MLDICCIKVLEGSLPGVVFMLPEDGEVLIGRHTKCFVRIIDDEISRRQAKLTWHDGQWVIEAVSKSVYTYVEGHAIHEPHILKNLDRIVVGTTMMEFQVSKVGADADANSDTIPPLADDSRSLSDISRDKLEDLKEVAELAGVSKGDADETFSEDEPMDEDDWELLPHSKRSDGTAKPRRKIIRVKPNAKRIIVKSRPGKKPKIIRIK